MEHRSRVTMIQDLETNANPSCEHCELTIAGTMF